MIRGGALYGSAYVLGIVLSLISVPLMTRYLGAVDYGRVVTVMALISAAAALTDGGLTTLGVREYTARPADDHVALMRAMVGLRMALSLAGVTGALLLVGALAYPAVLVLGTFLAGIGLLVGSVQKVMTIPLTASLRLGTVASLHLLEQSALVAFVALLVVAGAGLVPFFGMFLVSSLVAFIATARLTGWGITPPAVDLFTWRTLLRDMVPYGAALAISATAAVLVAMPLLTTDLEVGYFAIPVQVVAVLLGVWAVMSASTLPVLARAARDDPARLRYVLQRMIHAAVVFGVGVSIVTAVGADLAIRVLGGPTFEPAVLALQILAPTVAVGCVVAVWNLTLVSVRRVGWVLAVNLAVLAVTLALALVLVPTHGSTGAAIAVLGGQLLYLPGFGVGLKRADPRLGEPLRLLLLVALAAGIAVLAGVLVPAPTAIAMLISVVLYAGVLMLLGAIPPELRELFSFAQTTDHEPPPAPSTTA